MYKRQDDHQALNHTFASGDIGSLVVVTAAGITSTSDNVAEAQQLIEFMLSEPAQTYFTTDSLEYPLNSDVSPADVLPALDNSGRAFDVAFDDLGNGLEETIAIIEDSGIFG